MEKRTIPDNFIEWLIIKGMIIDEQYTASVATTFNKDYFNDKIVGELFSFIKDHFKKYNQLPPKDIIKKGVKDSEYIFKEIECIDYDISKNYNHLLEETNLYLKEQSFKDALMKGVELIESGKNPLEFKSVMEEALAKDLKIDLGIDYWGTLTERLNRIFTQSIKRISTGYLELDEFIAGGFPPYTLSVFLSKIHGFKTNFLVNLASRQVLKGLNPIIFSLETSEDSLCQRLDAIYSKQEINSIYVKSKEKMEMLKTLQNIKKNNGLGKLIIKELPPGKTSVQTLDNHLRELKYRKVEPGPIYVDYLQLLQGIKGDKRYEELKHISEELRSLSLTWNTPVISVCQLNKDGIFADFDSVDYTYVAGSIDIAATADFMAIFGKSEDNLVYESELHYKIVKNRLGGRVGEMGKLYIDKRSLKMYDKSEMDLWIDDAKISGDLRKLKQKN